MILRMEKGRARAMQLSKNNDPGCKGSDLKMEVCGCRAEGQENSLWNLTMIWPK